MSDSIEVSLSTVAAELPRMCCVCGVEATHRAPVSRGWNRVAFPKVKRRVFEGALGACDAHAGEVSAAARRITLRDRLSRFVPAALVFAAVPAIFIAQALFPPDPVTFEHTVTLPVMGAIFLGCLVAAVLTSLVLRRPVRRTVWLAGTHDAPTVGFDGPDVVALLS